MQNSFGGSRCIWKHLVKGPQLHHRIEVLISNTLSLVGAQLVNKIIENNLSFFFLSMFAVRYSSIHFKGHILACTVRYIQPRDVRKWFKESSTTLEKF